jgi:hypothetical protein
MRRPIPDAVRRFVLTSIASVPFLEALLLMRAHAGSNWDAGELARRLYVPAGLGEELLAQLGDSGFAVPCGKDGSWSWNKDTDMASLVDQLAEIYAENVIDVTELIHSRQERRAHQFADAFRLRKSQE